MTSRTRITFLFIFCFMMIGTLSLVIAGEKKITQTEVPAAVLKAFTTAYPKATIKACAVEEEKGEKFYELETVDGATKRDLLYKQDGTAAEIEESITAKTVPDVISKAISKEMPKAKIIGGEKTTKGADVSFEVIVANGKDKIRLMMNSKGEIEKNSIVKAKDEEEEDDEKEVK